MLPRTIVDAQCKASYADSSTPSIPRKLAKRAAPRFRHHKSSNSQRKIEAQASEKKKAPEHIGTIPKPITHVDISSLIGGEKTYMDAPGSGSDASPEESDFYDCDMKSLCTQSYMRFDGLMDRNYQRVEHYSMLDMTLCKITHASGLYKIKHYRAGPNVYVWTARVKVGALLLPLIIPESTIIHCTGGGITFHKLKGSGFDSQGFLEKNMFNHLGKGIFAFTTDRQRDYPYTIVLHSSQPIRRAKLCIRSNYSYSHLTSEDVSAMQDENMYGIIISDSWLFYSAQSFDHIEEDAL